MTPLRSPCGFCTDETWSGQTATGEPGNFHRSGEPGPYIKYRSSSVKRKMLVSILFSMRNDIESHPRNISPTRQLIHIIYYQLIPIVMIYTSCSLFSASRFNYRSIFLSFTDKTNPCLISILQTATSGRPEVKCDSRCVAFRSGNTRRIARRPQRLPAVQWGHTTNPGDGEGGGCKPRRLPANGSRSPERPEPDGWWAVFGACHEAFGTFCQSARNFSRPMSVSGCFSSCRRTAGGIVHT